MPSENIKASSPVIFGGIILSLLILLAALPYVGGQLGFYAVVALAGAAALSLFHPFILLALYFVTLFFKDTTFKGALPISLNQVIAPLLFIYTFIYALRGKTLPIRFWLLPFLAIVSLYFAVNGLFGEDFENGILYARYAIIYLVLAVSVAICLSTERAILALAWIVTGVTFLFALHGFYELFDKNLLGKFSGAWGGGVRVKGTAPNSIVFSWNMLYAFPFAFFLFSELKSRYTRPLAILMGLTIIAVATLTFNRQTYVLIVLVVGLSAVLFTYRNRAVLLGGLTALGAVGAFTVMPLILRRIMTVVDMGRDYSYLERRDSYLMAMEMIKSSPVFGIGFGSYSKVWSQYIPKDFSTYYAQYRGGKIEKFMDMGYMSITAETGLIGLLLFITLLFIILVRGIKYWNTARKAGDHLARNLASMVIVLLAYVAVTSLIQDTFLYTRIWIFYGVAMLLDERVLPIRPRLAETPGEHDNPVESVTSQ